MRELDGKYITLEKVDCRAFIITSNSEDVIIKYGEDYYVDTIIIKDEYRIKIGDTFKIGDIKYKVNLIRKYGKAFYCMQERITKTSQFIMPVLGNSYEYYDYVNSFYNSYLSEDYKYIYLVYRFMDTETYLTLEAKLREHIDFEEVIDPNPDMVVIKFKLPIKYKRDIRHIMKGEYTDISSELMHKICNFHKFDNTDKTYKMFYSPKLLKKEMEAKFKCPMPDNIDLISKPVKEKEIWSFQSILKKDGITI